LRRAGTDAAPSSQSTTAILMAAPAALAGIQFVATAGGKPGEFGRFGILPDVALLLGAFFIAQFAARKRERLEPIAGGILILLTAVFGLSYVAGFVEDRNDPRGTSSRMAAARALDGLPAGARTLAMRAEPAPYSLPPVDVGRWRLLLLPADGSIPAGGAAPDVIVLPTDGPAPEGEVAGTPYVRRVYTGRRPWFSCRISWADKPFEALIRRDLLDGSAARPP
jgi:hypothetical protein